MSAVVAGVDGGGTKTHAAIMDEEGRLLGEGYGGPSNYDHHGIAATRLSIATALQRARREAGLPDGPFDAVFLGMAGVVSPADRAAIGAIAAELALAAPHRTFVDHDCRIALAGGLSGRPGIVQIAGTGSSTFGVNRQGASWRAGGWGYLLADEGSGYWLGAAALRAGVRAYDGRGAPTALLHLVRERLGLSEIDEIMQRVYVTGMSPTAVAALAPLVFAAARAQDAVAKAIVEQGAREIALAVVAVARQLGMQHEPCELALVGGLFTSADLLLPPLREHLASLLPRCTILLAELPPALGACLLALQALGRPCSENVLNNLRRGWRAG